RRSGPAGRSRPRPILAAVRPCTRRYPPADAGSGPLSGAHNMATRWSSLGWRGEAARLRLRYPDVAPVRTAGARSGVDLRVRPDRAGPATHRPRAVGREL